MPNDHYISEAVFEEEKIAILFDNWSAIGFGKDIPEEGDAKPINFIDMPLLMVRDKNGEINVFQNTCRHRGMILVEEPTNITGMIRCPYHRLVLLAQWRPSCYSNGWWNRYTHSRSD